jgi:hypothetical protein
VRVCVYVVPDFLVRPSPGGGGEIGPGESDHQRVCNFCYAPECCPSNCSTIVSVYDIPISLNPLKV